MLIVNLMFSFSLVVTKFNNQNKLLQHAKCCFITVIYNTKLYFDKNLLFKTTLVVYASKKSFGIIVLDL